MVRCGKVGKFSDSWQPRHCCHPLPPLDTPNSTARGLIVQFDLRWTWVSKKNLIRRASALKGKERPPLAPRPPRLQTPSEFTTGMRVRVAMVTCAPLCGQTDAPPRMLCPGLRTAAWRPEGRRSGAAAGGCCGRGRSRAGRRRRGARGSSARTREDSCRAGSTGGQGWTTAGVITQEEARRAIWLHPIRQVTTEYPFLINHIPHMHALGIAVTVAPQTRHKKDKNYWGALSKKSVSHAPKSQSVTKPPGGGGGWYTTSHFFQGIFKAKKP